MMDLPKAREAADKIAKATGADVLVYNGDIHAACANRFIDKLAHRKRASNLLLVLVTPGGDPNEAYKIGRAALSLYKRVSVFVPGWCKSAGTLVAIAAHELIVADRGELGPIDVQIAKIAPDRVPV